MSLAKFIDEKVNPAIALSNFDQGWSDALNQSKVFGIWLAIKNLHHKFLKDNFSKFGNFLCFLSYLLSAVLFLILPAPYFAEDKGWLAMIVAAAFGFRILGALLSGKDKYTPSAVDFLVLAFVGMNIIATLGSHYLAASVKGLMKMAVYFCSYFLFASTIQQAPRTRGIVLTACLLVAGVVVSLHGLWQYKVGVAPLATWEDPNVEDKTVRIYSFLRNPNLLAGYLVPLIPVGFGAAIMAFVEGGWKRHLSITIFLASALILVATILTGSRGGYMGIAASLAALGFIILNILWSSKPKLRPALASVVVAIPVGLLGILHMFPKYEHRLLSIFAGWGHSSNAYRLNVYKSSFQMFLDNWWLGIGPGNSTFKLAYGLYMRTGFDALGTYCVPLEVAVETGIFGLFIFAWMILAALTRAHINFWNKFSGSERWLCAGAAAGLMGMMVHGLVDTVYYRPQVQFIFWLLLAMCAYIRPQVQGTEPGSSPGADEDKTLEAIPAAGTDEDADQK
ncbi:MAG: O-antigen ligase family protein [Candidatus Obscuribacterales bacterium]|nr:O-antigen ligase family protein [Candidatus Obscuribacterales bacterium]